MWITDNIKSLSLKGPSGLTIGAFDGMHRGHQALISELVEHTHAMDMRAVVVTFAPLPLQFFREPHDILLTSIEERAMYMEQLGVDGMVVFTFDRALANTSAHDFVTLMLRHLNMVDLWIGPDFALGRGRAGNGQALQQMGEERGFAVHIMEPFCWQGESVRSTRIRDLLHSGDLALANALLGHSYRLTGPLVSPKAKTSVIQLSISAEKLLPASGAYVCQIQQQAGQCGVIAYIRQRSASEHKRHRVDLHLLEAVDDLSRGALTLEFLKQLHSETAISAARIQEDITVGRRWLEERSKRWAHEVARSERQASTARK